MARSRGLGGPAVARVAAQADRRRYVAGMDRVTAGQVGERARDLQRPLPPPGADLPLRVRVGEDPVARRVETDVLTQQRRRHVSVAVHARTLEARLLALARGDHL